MRFSVRTGSEVFAFGQTQPGRLDTYGIVYGTGGNLEMDPVSALPEQVPVRPESHRVIVAPNPSSIAATCKLVVSGGHRGRLSIYDATGRIIQQLTNGEEVASGMSYEWDGRDSAGRLVNRPGIAGDSIS